MGKGLGFTYSYIGHECLGLRIKLGVGRGCGGNGVCPRSYNEVGGGMMSWANYERI